jgi:Tfp pilus assembly protein PilV
MRRIGFTLVEVLVAIVVLEVGLLGVAGTLVLAVRAMRRAETMERAVTDAERVYDSISSVAEPSSGSAAGALGPVRWTVATGGELLLEVLGSGSGPGDTVLFSARGLVAAPPAVP